MRVLLKSFHKIVHNYIIPNVLVFFLFSFVFVLFDFNLILNLVNLSKKRIIMTFFFHLFKIIKTKFVSIVFYLCIQCILLYIYI